MAENSIYFTSLVHIGRILVNIDQGSFLSQYNFITGECSLKCFSRTSINNNFQRAIGSMLFVNFKFH